MRNPLPHAYYITSCADRFADVTEQEIEALLSSRDYSSTKSSTRISVDCLREFCEQNKINFREVDRMCKTEFGDFQRKFYVSARTKTGELHQKNTQLYQIWFCKAFKVI